MKKAIIALNVLGALIGTAAQLLQIYEQLSKTKPESKAVNETPAD